MKIVPFLLLLLITLFSNAQEASVSILTQESWPPGKNVPVTIEIKMGEAEGFARFYHELPQGFSVENVISSGADFFRDNMQVNYVWLELPEQEIIIIQYLGRADELLAGSFKITGRFDYIMEGKKRVSVSAESPLIRLDRSATVENVELPEEYLSEAREKTGAEPEDTTSVELKLLIPDPLTTDRKTEEIKKEIPEVSFRVQVSISSQRISQTELEDRVGSQLKHGIRVLKSGNMFKYQSGSFKSYSDAAEYLNELKSNGVADAFIVAFEKGNQISIGEARSITEK